MSGPSRTRGGGAAFPLAAALCAAAVALVVVSPALRFVGDAGDAFRGIDFLCAKDAEYYVAQVRFVADGTYGHANDFLHEWSQGDAHGPPWTYRLLAFLHSHVGGSLHRLVLASLAVCAAAQFLLLTAVGRTLRLSRPWALAAAAAACLAPFLWSYRGGDLWLSHPERVTTGFLPLFRPVNPSVSSILVWGSLLVLIRWVRRPAWRTWALLLALAASQWTAYPAAFLVTGALVAGAAVVLLATGRRGDALRLALLGAAAAGVNAPAIAGTLARAGGGAEDALASNLLAIPSRAPMLSANTLTLAALAVLWGGLRLGRRRDRSPRSAVVAGAAIALVLLFNQQVLTGRLDQPFHYDWFWAVPLIWIGTAVVLSEAGARAAVAGRRLLASGPRRRALGAILVAAPAAVGVLVVGGPIGASVLRAAGLIRGEAVARPVLLVAAAAAASVAAWACVRWVLAHRWRRISAAVACVAGALALAEGWDLQSHEYLRRRQSVLAHQAVADALRHVAAHGSTDDVVLACDDEIARLVPSHTGRNVLVSAEAQFAAAPPDEEFRRRRYVAFALFGLPAEELAAGLGDGRRWHAALFKWRTFGPPPTALDAVSSGLHAAPLDGDAAARAVGEYRRTLALPRVPLLRTFRVDWVLWRDDAARAGLRDPGAGDGLDLVLDGGGVRLYRVAGR